MSILPPFINNLLLVDAVDQCVFVYSEMEVQNYLNFMLLALERLGNICENGFVLLWGFLWS